MRTSRGCIRALPLAAGVAALAALIHGGAAAQGEKDGRQGGERKPGLTIEYQGPAGEAPAFADIQAEAAPGASAAIETIQRGLRESRGEMPPLPPPPDSENPQAETAADVAGRRGPGWHHGDIVDIGGRRYNYYYAPRGGLTVYAEKPDNKVVYDVAERSRRQWTAGHYEEVKVEEEIEGQTVTVFHPAVYARQADGSLKMLEEERTDTVPKTRLIVTHRWVEGNYVYGKAGDEKVGESQEVRPALSTQK